MLVEITTLNGRNAIRERDTNSTVPDELAPLRYFEPKPEWRIVADWTAFDAPRGMTIGTTGEIDTEVEVTHKAAFTKDGVRYELIPTHGTPEAPQFVIRDLTSKDDTYPASRFVYGEEVGDKTIVLDFNKAINPPLRLHRICRLPASATGKRDAGPDRGGGEAAGLTGDGRIDRSEAQFPAMTGKAAQARGVGASTMRLQIRRRPHVFDLVRHALIKPALLCSSLPVAWWPWPPARRKPPSSPRTRSPWTR